MRLTLRLLLVGLVTADPGLPDDTYSGPEHFVFFNRDRHRISEASFLETAAITGAQLKYTWRELEPERDRYDLGPLLEDLEFLEAHGKRLFVHLQDVSFDERINVPQYLIDEPEYRGGVARKYELEGGEESSPRFDGWVARRWDPAVIGRFQRLLRKMGAVLDGRIEGLNLAETSISFGETGELHPEGFDSERYAEGVKAIMTAARAAFPRSRVIQYANFMPGEWLPWEDRGYLRGVYAHAEQIGIGVGGPDLLPHRRGQQNHSYRLIAARGAGLVAGVAVQAGNLQDRDPKTGRPITPAELYHFARDTLRLDYLFWGAEGPDYASRVLPYLRGLADAHPRRPPVPPGPGAGATPTGLTGS